MSQPHHYPRPPLCAVSLHWLSPAHSPPRHPATCHSSPPVAVAVAVTVAHHPYQLQTWTRHNPTLPPNTTPSRIPRRLHQLQPQHHYQPRRSGVAASKPEPPAIGMLYFFSNFY